MFGTVIFAFHVLNMCIYDVFYLMYFELVTSCLVSSHRKTNLGLC